MKKGYQFLFCMLLVPTLLVSGFPVLSPEDAVRDNRIDLRDAILHIRYLVESGEDVTTFRSELRNTISTIQSLAGLKTILQSDSTKSKSIPLTMDNLYLIPGTGPVAKAEYRETIKEENIHYRSLTIRPALPPPKERHS